MAKVENDYSSECLEPCSCVAIECCMEIRTPKMLINFEGRHYPFICIDVAVQVHGVVLGFEIG